MLTATPQLRNEIYYIISHSASQPAFIKLRQLPHLCILVKPGHLNDILVTIMANDLDGDDKNEIFADTD